MGYMELYRVSQYMICHFAIMDNLMEYAAEIFKPILYKNQYFQYIASNPILKD